MILIVDSAGTIHEAAAVQFHPAWGLAHKGNNAWAATAATAGGEFTEIVSHDKPIPVTREKSVTRSVTRHDWTRDLITATTTRDYVTAVTREKSVTRSVTRHDWTRDLITATTTRDQVTSVTRIRPVSVTTTRQTVCISSVTREVTEGSVSDLVSREKTVTRWVTGAAGDTYCECTPDVIYSMCFQIDELGGVPDGPECTCFNSALQGGWTYYVLIGGAYNTAEACELAGCDGGAGMPTCALSVGPAIDGKFYCGHFAVCFV